MTLTTYYHVNVKYTYLPCNTQQIIIYIVYSTASACYMESKMTVKKRELMFFNFAEIAASGIFQEHNDEKLVRFVERWQLKTKVVKGV